jgi:hypothetical protein
MNGPFRSWEDEMVEMAHKVRLALLWVVQMIAFFAYRTVAIDEGATEVSVRSNRELVIYLAVMMVFAVLTLTLTRRLNRVTNLIAGAIFLVLQLIMFVDGLVGYGAASFNWMTLATVVSMALVVWFAYRWRASPADGSA